MRTRRALVHLASALAGAGLLLLAPLVAPAAADVAQCADGLDNDGDGKTDYPADPGCSGTDDDLEGPGCDPVADGVVVCLTPGAVVDSFAVDTLAPGEGAAHGVAGYVELYQFLAGEVTVNLPCVVLVVDGTTTDACDLAGGTHLGRMAVLAETPVAEPTVVDGPVLATVDVCLAELTATALDIGVKSAPAYVVC